MIGADIEQGGSHSQKAATATLGLPKGLCKPNAQQFRLKGTGTFQLPEGK